MKARSITTLLLAGDFLIFYGALFTTLVIRYLPLDDTRRFINLHVVPFGIIFILWLFVFGSFGLYDIKFMRNSKRFLYRLLKAMGTNAMLAVAVFYLIPYFEIEPRRNLLLIAVLSIFFIFAWRYAINFLIIRTPSSKILFFGMSKEMSEFANFLQAHPQLGQRVAAIMPISDEKNISTRQFTSTDAASAPYIIAHGDVQRAIREHSIDTIVISSDIKENKIFVKTLFQAIPLGVAIVEFPSMYEALTGKIPASLIGEVWFLENLVGVRRRFYDFIKRSFDVCAAILLSLPVGILFPIIALAIKLDSDGPIFFRQIRVGKNKREFLLIKFRSMVKDADKISGFKGDETDARHTRVGAFLRKNYIDELPQILNILRGEMSFVGPRPERPEYVERLKQNIPFYEMRLLASPGLTGWAQINMGDDASVEDAPEKMQFDLYYVKNRSFMLDLLISLRTLFILSRREGR